jgi:predicted Zn-dependent protease
MSQKPNQNQNKSQPGRPAKSAWLGQSRVVVLGAAAILIVVAIILLNSNVHPFRPAKPGITLADQVRSQAQTAIDAGLNQAACDLLTAYCRKNPQDTELAIMLAKTLRQLGRAGEAELLVAGVLKISPQMPEALWLCGELTQARKGPNAQKFFDLAVQSPLCDKNPATGRDIWAKYALQLLEAGQDQQARQYLQKASDAGLADARTAYGFGALASRAGQYDQAAKYLNESVHLDPANPQAQALLADAQVHLGQAGLARQTLGQALTKCLDKSRLFMELGNLELSEGKPAQAAEAFAGACNYSSARVEASLLAAEAFYQAGQFARAMEYIDQAKALNNPSPEVNELLAKIEDARFGQPVKSTFQP